MAVAIVRDILQVLFFIFIVKPFMMFIIGLRVKGNREIFSKYRQLIIYANHTSHLDAVCILSLFPLRRLRRVRPCAASDYFERNKIIYILTRTFFNILPIERKNITPQRNPLKVMEKALEEGYSLIIFPEGTRGSGEGLNEFKSGIVHIVKKFPNIPIIPIYIEGTNRSLPKGEFLIVPFFCEVIIGEPLNPIEGNKEEILNKLKDALLRLRE